MAVADKNTFYIHWSLIKLKNVTINSIQFITFGTDTRGGSATGGAHNQMTCVFRLQSVISVVYGMLQWTSCHHS